MGACTSVPKAMQAEGEIAPPPEQPKEETTAEVVAELEAEKEDQVVEEGEKKAENGGDELKEKETAAEEKVVDGDKNPSIEALLNESEAPAEEAKGETTSQKENDVTTLPVADAIAPATSEIETTALADGTVSQVTPETEETAKATPVAEVSKGGKKEKIAEEK